MGKLVTFGVYGTLKTGGSNHELLEHPNVNMLGHDQTLRQFTMIDFGTFPAIVPLGTTSIILEVYETEDEWIIERLNQLEGFKGEDNPDNLYDFAPVKTQAFNGVHLYQMKLTHPWIDKRKGVIMDGNWNPKRDNPQPKIKPPRLFNIPPPPMPKPRDVPVPDERIDHIGMDEIRVEGAAKMKHNDEIDKIILIEKEAFHFRNQEMNANDILKGFREIENRFNLLKVI